VPNVGDLWSDLKGKPEAGLSVKYPDPYYFIPSKEYQSQKVGEASQE
jgi:hypothetical protein